MGYCTIVMYHYVRPLAGSRIKGLDLELFDRQLDYIQRYYTVVSVEQVLAALDARASVPLNSALLTFDDGFVDHYSYVLPRLLQRKVAGAFFPPAAAVLNRVPLDVHKLHHVLASSADVDELDAFVDRSCDDRRAEFGLDTISDYRSKYWRESRYDPANVCYLKHMLQHALPEPLRHELTRELFARHVSADEASFADELYLSTAQLREMVSAGMHVGSHGHRHCWLSRQDRAGQESEIFGSLALLRAVGCDSRTYTICYPYGDFDAVTIEIASAAGFRAGFTTKVGLAEIDAQHRFALSRLDTNDFPKIATAPANEWTLRVAG